MAVKDTGMWSGDIDGCRHTFILSTSGKAQFPQSVPVFCARPPKLSPKSQRKEGGGNGVGLGG